MTPYTRHQLLVLLVVLVGVGLGLAVGHWRRAHPDLVERLERLDRRPAPEARDVPAAPRGGAPRPRAPGPPTSEAVPVDVNRAGANELARLPGVGPALAARIVAAREAAGPFATPDDLRRVRGLGRVKIARLRPLVRIAE